jgi:hypothetical protein
VRCAPRVRTGKAVRSRDALAAGLGFSTLEAVVASRSYFVELGTPCECRTAGSRSMTGAVAVVYCI